MYTAEARVAFNIVSCRPSAIVTATAALSRICDGFQVLYTHGVVLDDKIIVRRCILGSGGARNGS